MSKLESNVEMKQLSKIEVAWTFDRSDWQPAIFVVKDNKTICLCSVKPLLCSEILNAFLMGEFKILIFSKRLNRFCPKSNQFFTESLCTFVEKLSSIRYLSELFCRKNEIAHKQKKTFRISSFPVVRFALIIQVVIVILKKKTVLFLNTIYKN